VTTIRLEKTGCYILDGAFSMPLKDPFGVSRDICLDCPLGACVLDRNIKRQEPEPEEPMGREIDIQCLACQTLETLELVEGRLGPHPRFVEYGGQTIHLTPDGESCGVCKRLG